MACWCQGLVLLSVIATCWLSMHPRQQSVDVQFLTNALRSGSINAGTLLRGESLANENWLQEAAFK
jgi:hypothetical protein